MSDENSKQPTISYTNTTPYKVVGDIEIKDLLGKIVSTSKINYLCRCGKSKKMPLCDGSHLKINFNLPFGKSKLPNRRLNYRGKEILIHFNPAFCSHDGSCLRMLPAVFNQSNNPWVNANGAPINKIIETINHCPSGALSYTLNGERFSGIIGRVPFIKCVKYGPLEVGGSIRLIDEERGAVNTESSERYCLCRCGLSNSIPFCDGSHFASDMDD